jgi:hypothetical protein
VVHGADDAQVPVNLSERYARRVETDLRILPGIEHFGLIDPLSTAWPAVLRCVRAVSDPFKTGTPRAP